MSDLIQASLAEIRARLAGGDVSAEAVAKACKQHSAVFLHIHKLHQLFEVAHNF